MNKLKSKPCTNKILIATSISPTFRKTISMCGSKMTPRLVKKKMKNAFVVALTTTICRSLKQSATDTTKTRSFCKTLELG